MRVQAPPAATAATPPPRLVVVLDLDNTLVAPVPGWEHPPEPSAFRVEVLGERGVHRFTVHKRPGVDEFLRELSARGYEVALFTTAIEDYARQVLERLDPHKQVFAHFFHNAHCTQLRGNAFTKDLAILNRPLSRVVLVDDNLLACLKQPSNAIFVPRFLFREGEPAQDSTLAAVAAFLRDVDGQADVRPFLKRTFDLETRLKDKAFLQPTTVSCFFSLCNPPAPCAEHAAADDAQSRHKKTKRAAVAC